MDAAAFFGKPRAEFTDGGAHLTVYLVPIFEARIIAFDVAAPGARDRWLPWGILTYGGNPYEDASALADDWCQGSVGDLRLVDVLTGTAVGSWEVALIFRAELTAMPKADGKRSPVALSIPIEAPVRQFQPAELERWLGVVAGAQLPDETPQGERLVF